MKTLKELVEFAGKRTENFKNNKDRFIIILCANNNVKDLIKENLEKLGCTNEGGVDINNLYLFIRYGRGTYFDMSDNRDDEYGVPYHSEEIFWLE